MEHIPRELNTRADELATSGLRRRAGEGGFMMTSVMLRRVVCIPLHLWVQTDGGCREGTMGGGIDVRVRCRGHGATVEWRDLYRESMYFGERGTALKAETMAMRRAVEFLHGVAACQGQWELMYEQCLIRFPRAADHTAPGDKRTRRGET